jgi:hypothetical protein
VCVRAKHVFVLSPHVARLDHRSKEKGAEAVRASHSYRKSPPPSSHQQHVVGHIRAGLHALLLHKVHLHRLLHVLGSQALGCTHRPHTRRNHDAICTEKQQCHTHGGTMLPHTRRNDNATRNARRNYDATNATRNARRNTSATQRHNTRRDVPRTSMASSTYS